MKDQRNISAHAVRMIALMGILLFVSWAYAEAMERNVLLVKFNININTEAAQVILNRTSPLSVELLSPLAPQDSASRRWWRVIYTTPSHLQEAATQLARDPGVEHVERPEPVSTH